jgi:inner membrane protein
MDNLCHTLVGAAMGEAGLSRRSRFATTALVIAANLPDVDVLVFATNTPSVAFRRGWTHGVGAQLLLPLLLAGALWLVARRAPPVGHAGAPLRMGWVLALSYLGVSSHVALDYLNTYGIRLLTPFDWRWFYGDAVFIIDPWLWLMLGLGVWFARRKRRVLPAAAALCAATLYVGVMVGAARSARSVVLTAWTGSAGGPPRALMVGPVPLNPFAREVIVDAGDHYRRARFAWPSSVVFSEARIAKNDHRPEVGPASGAPNVRGFLVWSRFPFWVFESVEGGTRVTVTDARFMARGAMFSASTVVNPPRAPRPEPRATSP